MSKRKFKKAPGQIRQSQLITSFGPGAMVDLPDYSVLIGGLETWRGIENEIIEPRLVDKLKQLFDPPLQELSLFAPPQDSEDPTGPLTGITAWQFPEWFITQDVDQKQGGGIVRARMLVARNRLTNRTYFVDDERRKRSVVPVRFVRACRRGHIGDLDWYEFAHGGKTDCRRQLWLEDRGTSGDLGEVWVRCECGKGERSMSQAIETPKTLGRCDGGRPWLGGYANEKCGTDNRLLVRNASNAYFPQLMNVISLPGRDEGLREAVEAVWDFVGEAEDVQMVTYERKKARVKSALEGFSDEQVFAEIKVRRGQSAEEKKKVKHAELETLIGSKDELGDDKPDGDFFARKLDDSAWQAPWMKSVERIVLVHRLREVMAQVGFTRFEAVSPDIDGELELGVTRASLTQDQPTWLPAVENRGEGVFIQFKSDAIARWATRPDVKARGEKLLAGYEEWKEDHAGAEKSFVESGGLLPYVLLHSFSHLLISAMSLECGYPASSIRERIYTVPKLGYGVLLYTGSSDAEGTLGGLIQVGRNIHKHIRNAIRSGELCSNDPVCAQHQPANQHEHRFLHGAACHGCLLISETSCEQHNEFLDRTLVVPTVENLGVEFFDMADS